MSLFNLPPYDFDLGVWLCDQLTWLRSEPNTVNIDQAVTAATQSSVVSYSERIGTACPPYYWGVSDNTTVILIGPTQDIVMAAGLWFNYSLLSKTWSGPLENGWAKDAAAAIVQRGRANHMPTPRQLILAGYSAGGMVAQALFNLYGPAGLDLNPTLITIGSPRECGDTLRDAVGQSAVTRWMNDDDGVPLIPPRVQDGTGWLTITSPLDMIQYGRFCHTAGGVSLSSTGVPTSSVLPLSATLQPTLSIAAFLVQASLGTTGGHALNEYRRRLALARSTLGPAPQPMQPREPRELPADSRRQQLNQVQQQAVQNVFRAGQVQDAVAVQIPQTLKAKAVKQGRIWSVYWGDTFICTGPTKKKCLHAKNVFNAFLVSLQRMAITEPDALVHQFQNYFDLATEAGNGFVPIMQDEFPEE